MANYIRKYGKMVDELVKKSFPELKSCKIRFIEVPRFFPFWSFVQRGFGSFFIFLNKVYRKLDDNAVKGGLAHELCHIVLDHQYRGGLNDFLHNFIKYWSSSFNTKMSRKIETEVDREVIRRGYAGPLLASHNAGETFFSKKIVEMLHARGYLTPEQIKSYAKKIGNGDYSWN